MQFEPDHFHFFSQSRKSNVMMIAKRRFCAEEVLNGTDKERSIYYSIIKPVFHFKLSQNLVKIKLSSQYLCEGLYFTRFLTFMWTDCVEGSTQNFFWPQSYFCAKRASKIIVPSKEMLLSFSIGTFLTNYDVTK